MVHLFGESMYSALLRKKVPLQSSGKVGLAPVVIACCLVAGLIALRALNMGPLVFSTLSAAEVAIAFTVYASRVRRRDAAWRTDIEGTIAAALASEEELARIFVDNTADTKSISAAILDGVNAMEEQAAQVNTVVSVMSDQNSVTHELAGNARAVDENVKKISAIIDGHAAAIAEISATISQFSENTRTISDVSATADRSAVNLAGVSQKGKATLLQTQRSIVDLTESMKSIGKFNGIIIEIAERTKLLGLNAAIEAAHAGQMGRGFSVVAKEIYKLSELSNGEAEKVRAMMVDLQGMTDAVAANLEETLRRFDEVVRETEGVTSAIGQVRNAMVEQAGGTEEMVLAIKDIQSGTSDLESSGQDLTRIGEDLSGRADMIHQVITKTSDAMEKLRGHTEGFASTMERIYGNAVSLDTMTESMTRHLIGMKSRLDELSEHAAGGDKTPLPAAGETEIIQEL